MACVALIPARGGSKGIKLKNIKDFNGKPLIVWAIEACIKSGVFDEVWVSTEHERIAQIADAAGALVHHRSAESATDEASTEMVMEDFSRAHPGWELMALVQATSPLTKAQDFVDAFKAFHLHAEADSLVTVTRQHRFRWSDETVTEALNYDPMTRPRRQDWPGELHENGAFYFITAAPWAKRHCRVGEKPMCFIQPSYTAYEIDDVYDWDILQSIHKKLLERNPEISSS